MDVLKEFQAAIEIEYQKNLEDFDEQMSLPLEERIAKGVTMSNLKIEFDFFPGLPNQWCSMLPSSQKYISTAKVFCENNISKFKEGNSIVLSNGPYKFEMDIEEDSTENFILKPNEFNVKYCFIEAADYPKTNWEINTVKTDIGTKLLLTAAQVLKDNSSILYKIDHFLNGKTTNTFNHFSQDAEHLNRSQNIAYLNAINASDFCIIQGPPGTGKTETIANIAKQFLDVGLKIFITAPTHTAINNCLNAISSRVKNANKVVKIGEKAQNKETQNNGLVTKRTRLTYYSSNYDQKGIIIGATAYSLCYPATKRLDGWEFDVVIVDEASQLSIPLSIAAMCRAKKYIFVGDHKQLDPIIPKSSNNEMFSESVFSRLARIYPSEINLLNTSYRLNKSLIKIPNALFYDGLLESAPSTQEDSTRYQCNNRPEIINGSSHELIIHNVFDAQGRSSFEAKLVSEIVSDLLKNEINIKDIGIMSPYRAQVREMKKEIAKVLPQNVINPFDSLFVDTVDSMQGQERSFIIYSLSNSHPLESMRRLDFFYSPNRLNVAITRAIKKCIVIANYKVFDIKEEELKDHKEYEGVKNGLNIFRQYFNMSSKIEIKLREEEEW